MSCFVTVLVLHAPDEFPAVVLEVGEQEIAEAGWGTRIHILISLFHVI